MSFGQKVKEELWAVVITTLYFGCWILALMVLKWLILAEYAISFQGWSMALVGAVVLAKVVLVLDHFSLGGWVRQRPAWLEVLLRTALYTLGVAVVLILEKSFEGRHAAGGFVPALQNLFRQADIHHVWATTICLSGALLVYNAQSVVRRYLGEIGLIRMFLSPLPEETTATPLQQAMNAGKTETGDRH
jgi:hypothetical protein